MEIKPGENGLQQERMSKMRSLAIIIMAVALFVAPVPHVWADSRWHFNQARINRAYNESLRRQAQYWKKFDAEMSRVKNDFGAERRDSSPCVKRPTKRR